VTPAPATRHQQAVAKLVHDLYEYAQVHGGVVLPAPTDVVFSTGTVLEPDVLYVSAEHAARIEDRFVRDAPDLVVEVSSPWTRRLELVWKLDVYQRFGVPEYWYIDLEAERVEVYRLARGQYGRPSLVTRGEMVESAAAPGFRVRVDDLVAEPRT
jgi:Uma2 family endonuclease